MVYVTRFHFLAGAGTFPHCHCVQTSSGAHPASFPVGTRGPSPGSKAAGVWSWPLTSIKCWGYKCMELAIPSLPICLHGMVLSWAQGQLHKTPSPHKPLSLWDTAYLGTMMSSARINLRVNAYKEIFVWWSTYTKIFNSLFLWYLECDWNLNKMTASGLLSYSMSI